MATAKEVFEALPHIDEVWITKDGNHYLDENSGGVRVARKVEIPKIKIPEVEIPDADIDAEVDADIEIKETAPKGTKK